MKTKTPQPLLCYICGYPIKKSHSIIFPSVDVVLGDGTRIKRKKRGRHESCAPGTLEWMNSEVGRKSSYRRYFLASYQNDPEFKEEWLALTTANSDIEQDSPVKDSPPKKTKKDTYVEKNTLLKELYDIEDPKEQAKLRRQLRKQGVYISQLKKGVKK